MSPKKKCWKRVHPFDAYNQQKRTTLKHRPPGGEWLKAGVREGIRKTRTEKGKAVGWVGQMFSVKSWVGGAVVCSVGMPRRPRPYAVLGKKNPTRSSREGIQKREQKKRVRRREKSRKRKNQREKKEEKRGEKVFLCLGRKPPREMALQKTKTRTRRKKVTKKKKGSRK
jgi:hypothetical protein